MPMPHVGVVNKPVKTIYHYDNGDNLINTRRFYATGEPWVNDTYLMLGLFVKANEYFLPKNELINTDTLKLDVKGEIIERYSYAKGVGLFTKSYFKYNENDQQIEEDTYRNDGSFMFKRRLNYDQDGNIILDSHPNGDQRTYTYTYEKYDKFHNWLTQTEYMDGRPVKVNERRITYH